jgi:hypothetical protein
MHYIKEGSFLPSSRIANNTCDHYLILKTDSTSNYNGIMTKYFRVKSR